MQNNGNDWNRNREGSIRERNESGERYNRNRDYDFDSDDYNRSERNYGSQGSNYGSSGYNQDSNRGYGNDYSGGQYRNSGNINRGGSGYTGEDRNWNSGDEWRRRTDFNRSSDWNRGSGYSGSAYGNYDERFDNSGNRSNDRFGDRNSDRNWWNRTKDEVSSWFGDDDAERRRRMDEMRENQGEFRGKGPKGYTRSDDRIKEDVNDSLSDDPHVDASDINVMVNNAEVTLTGTVKDRWQKRHAEDIAERVSGVRNVENRIKVGTTSNTTNGISSGASATGATRSTSSAS